MGFGLNIVLIRFRITGFGLRISDLRSGHTRLAVCGVLHPKKRYCRILAFGIDGSGIGLYGVILG